MCYIRVRLVHHARRYRSCAYKGRPAKSIEIQRNGQHGLEYTACCNAILRKSLTNRLRSAGIHFTPKTVRLMTGIKGHAGRCLGGGDRS